MIRILIVDDSRTARLVLTNELDRVPDFKVVGAAASALEAQRLIAATTPDVMTLDLQMPGMGGLDFLDAVMAEYPALPVVIVSSLTHDGSGVALEALRLGAVDVVGKARLGADSMAARRLIDAIRAAGQSSIRVSAATRSTPPHRRPVDDRSVADGRADRDIIALGASTGGTRAIEALLRRLPRETPGLVITQHLPAAFTASFAARLNAVSALDVREACHGEPILPGTALVAPGDCDLTLMQAGSQRRVHLIRHGDRDTRSSSIDALFHSVAATSGSGAIGVLLTGMGSDGAHGLAAIRRAGGLTIAEHEETCVVYGMPRAAVEMNAATAVAPLHDIPAMLLRALGRTVAARI